MYTVRDRFSFGSRFWLQYRNLLEFAQSGIAQLRELVLLQYTGACFVCVVRDLLDSGSGFSLARIFILLTRSLLCVYSPGSFQL